jgi:hypothetical protein
MAIQLLRSQRFMKVAMWAVFLIVLPSFVAFYGFSAKGKSQYVDPNEAMVTLVFPDGDKEELGRDQLLLAKQDLQNYYVNLYSRLSGQAPNQEIARMFSSQLSNQEIAEHALTRAALERRIEEQEIVVGSKQVEESLKNAGITKAQLDASLKAQRMSQAQFLMQQRGELTKERGTDSVQRVARTSLLETWMEYRRAKEKLTVGLLYVPSAPFRDTIEPTDAELTEELALVSRTSPETITKAAERVYSYVKVSPPLPDPVEPPTEEEILAALNAAPATETIAFAGSGTRIQHALISVNMRTTDTMLLDESRARAAALRERIAAGEDFATVANEYSEDLRNLIFDDPQTSPTLLNGFIPRPISGSGIDVLAWGEEFANFADTAEVGKLSGIIETPQGFSVARVVERGDNLRRNVAEVRDYYSNKIFEERMKADEAKRKKATAELVEKLREIAATQSTMEGIAREAGVEVGKTDAIPVDRTFFRGIGDLSRDYLIIEDLRLNEISPVVTTASGDAVVLKVVERQVARTETLDEARPKLVESFKFRRADEMAKARAEEIRASLKADDRVTTIGIERGLKVKSLDEPFTRAALPPELIQITNFSNASLSAGPMGTLIAKSSGGPEEEGYAVVQVLTIEAPDRAAFLAELQTFEMNMLAAKRQGILEDFYDDAQATVKLTASELFIPKKDESKAKSG